MNQSDHSTSDQDREERFDEICADFLDAVDGGHSFDKEQVLTANPDLAESLRNFFHDHERMAGVLDMEDPEGDQNSAHPNKSSSRQGVDQTIALGDAAKQPSGFSAVESMSGQHGKRIADYELIEKIAHGGMGVVYKARQLTLNRVVALKMIRSGELADNEEVQRFRAEAEAAAQLHHPGIVPIYQIGVEGGQNFFSMAYIEGDSLAHRIREQALPPKVAAAYVMKVARAVHYAHEQGIIHRDIKPANVLLDADDNPMVTDFGLAKQIQSDHKLTMSGQVLGTASYMSPEQARGDQSQVGRRSDVYSLGALLYTLLTQRPPFTGDNPIEILLDVLSKDPVAPLVERSGSFNLPFLKNLSGISKAWIAKEDSATSSSSTMRFSRDIETICMKCLEKKPANRYSSAEALADDLERFLNGVPILARPVNVIERTIRWCRRKPAISTSIALAVALILAIAIGLAVNEGPASVSHSLFVTVARDANKHYLGKYLDDDLLDANRYDGQDRLYVLASRAMLLHSILELEPAESDTYQSMHSSARKDYERLARELRSTLDKAPSDSIRFALADCYTQLGRFFSVSEEAGQQYFEDAETQLTSMTKKSALVTQLLVHVRELQNQAYYASLSDTDLSRLERVRKGAARLRASVADADTSKAAKSIDSVSNGVVRFEFADEDLARPLVSERVIQSHTELMKNGRTQGAKAYNRLGMDFEEEKIELTSQDRQQVFTDLTLLSERMSGNRGNAATTSLPFEMWPGIWAKDPRGIYDTVLGIALANDKSADRNFQLKE